MPRTNRTFDEIDRERYPFRGYKIQHKSVHSGSGCRFAYTTTKLTEDEYKKLRAEAEEANENGADLSWMGG